MGGRHSNHVHSHLHIHEGTSNCPCDCHFHTITGSSSASQPPDYRRIGDDFESLEQVTDALIQAGLESSNLIVGIDFTASNEWTGKRSFMGRNLHSLGRNCPNPYEQAISIIGRTLQKFDEDDKIPCYGFGDETTGDQEVFSFQRNDRPCHGFGEVLSCYRDLVPHVVLAGPTSFGPIIRNAIRIVNDTDGRYHILMIIADGQVTRSVDTPEGELSLQEESTVAAIVEASKYPLSIIIVGVGDGPWDQMYECDDHISTRDFDNVQFVNFTEIMEKNIPMSKKEALFALNALMEIPEQYKATINLQLLGKGKETPGQFSFPQPPPIPNIRRTVPNIWRTNSSRNELGSGLSSPFISNIWRTNSSRNEPGSGLSSPFRSEYYPPSSSFDRLCPKCYLREKDLAFGCGHQTCSDCGEDLDICPTCQTEITTQIKLLN